MISGKTLRDAMISASNALSNVKQSVDALNVFPVPDGDTGTNMSMTIGNAARELGRLEDPTATQVADVASSALLRGARGNSGVILSLLFRGFSKGLKGKDEADGVDLANALTLGMEAAYKAVMKPTEGTILTVAREAAAAGTAVAASDPDPIAVWEAICTEAEASLERTPELLPQLKKAGVVDAGGKGLCIILRAMLDIFKGGEIVGGDAPAAAQKVQKKSTVGSFEQDIKFAYCTEFIVGRGKDCEQDVLALRAYLESIGDCVVVVDDDECMCTPTTPAMPWKRRCCTGSLKPLRWRTCASSMRMPAGWRRPIMRRHRRCRSGWIPRGDTALWLWRPARVCRRCSMRIWPATRWCRVARP